MHHHYFVIAVTLLASGATLAQLKTGSNPRIINSTLAFEAEASDASRFAISKANANVGINTTTPSTPLDINGMLKTEQLQITQNAGLGKILVSDAQGVAKWQKKVITEVQTSGNTVVIYAPSTSISCLNDPVFDSTKTVFGSAYGWDNTALRYVAPETGAYRITLHQYSMPPASGYANTRVYAYRNGGGEVIALTSISNSSTGGPKTAYTNNVFSLNAGDTIDVRNWLTSNNLFCGKGYTYFRVESL